MQLSLPLYHGSRKEPMDIDHTGCPESSGCIGINDVPGTQKTSER